MPFLRNLSLILFLVSVNLSLCSPASAATNCRKTILGHKGSIVHKRKSVNSTQCPLGYVPAK